MQLANGEISDEGLIELSKYFKVTINVDDAEIYLSPKKRNFTPEEVLRAIQIVGESQPDECDFEGDKLRLW